MHCNYRANRMQSSLLELLRCSRSCTSCFFISYFHLIFFTISLPCFTTFTLAKVLRNLLSRIMRVTENKMRRMPKLIRMVKTSPNKRMPNRAAVTGSSAPIMAVGVEPMHCIAIAINTREMTVGTKPKVNAMLHCRGVWSICNAPVGVSRA